MHHSSAGLAKRMWNCPQSSSSATTWMCSAWRVSSCLAGEPYLHVTVVQYFPTSSIEYNTPLIDQQLPTACLSHSVSVTLLQHYTALPPPRSSLKHTCCLKQTSCNRPPTSCICSTVVAAAVLLLPFQSWHVVWSAPALLPEGSYSWAGLGARLCGSATRSKMIRWNHRQKSCQIKYMIYQNIYVTILYSVWWHGGNWLGSSRFWGMFACYLRKWCITSSSTENKLEFESCYKSDSACWASWFQAQ